MGLPTTVLNYAALNAHLFKHAPDISAWGQTLAVDYLKAEAGGSRLANRPKIQKRRKGAKCGDLLD